MIVIFICYMDSLNFQNIPNKYNQEMLLEAINKNFKGSYDFFYLPIDFKVNGFFFFWSSHLLLMLMGKLLLLLVLMMLIRELTAGRTSATWATHSSTSFPFFPSFHFSLSSTKRSGKNSIPPKFVGSRMRASKEKTILSNISVIPA